MIAFIIIVVIASCNSLSIGSVSDKNVKKRDAGDLFPDWVPFKNKHGDELGEFVQVVKAKPKKRLALPVNFILRAVAEPEGDDYYDKGQGESEDYYEKKEWSDLNRPVQSADSQSNHTAISDIDGVVSILTKKQDDPLLKILNEQNAQNDSNKEKVNEDDDNESTDVTSKENKHDDNKSEKVNKDEQNQSNEEDVEYDENNTEKQKKESSDDEKAENEAKKAKILDSVDDLKERHAEEQRAISERVKEEEIYKEEQERDRVQFQGENEKYNEHSKPKRLPDYEEYEEKDVGFQDKYEKSPLRIRTTTTKASRQNKKNKAKKEKLEEPGKLSVFKNPQLYMIYDDSEETTTVRYAKSRKHDRFSSRYTTTPLPSSDDSDRISLVPLDNSKAGEPTLFFPKKRKNKRKKVKSTTPASDSYVAETIADKIANGLMTALDTTASDTTVADTTGESDTSGTGDLPTETDSVTDAVPASTDHKKEEHKPVDYHNEKGGGREFHSENEESHEEHGKKAYEGVHEDTKTAKGHHDKENHLGKYDDQGDVRKEHLDESGHYGAHHHEEHGKKNAKYEESGKHSKGHSTKGSHDIHKKEEYEKNVEFFEEEGDSAEDEKHGGFNEEHGHAKGGHYNKGNLHAGHQTHTKGDSGHFGKGGHVHVLKGHKSSGGHDGHGHHAQNNFRQGGKDAGKKWVYHHGHPAKTANLVIIDRRTDKYMHGPQYYG